MKTNTIDLGFTPCQKEIFGNVNHRFKVVPKGRRLGATEGMARAAIWYCHIGLCPVLWGDTSYANIENYVERNLIPFCNQNKIGYSWNKFRKIFRTGDSFIDFRSAENPEKWEGQKYRMFLCNEAGIVLKNNDLWEKSVVPMLTDLDGFAILAGTPKGKTFKSKETLFYALQQKALSGEEDWWTKTYSTHYNPHLTKKQIQSIINTLPSHVVRQEIYGEFIDHIGGLLERRYVNNVDYLPEKLTIYFGVDLAVSQSESADYTSICVMGVDESEGKDNNKYYIIEVFEFKATEDIIQQNIMALAAEYKPKMIAIEKVAAQDYLIQSLKNKCQYRIEPVVPKGSKTERFYPLLVKYEAGKVYHYSQGRGVQSYINQALDFPNVGHDDMVDSAVLAYHVANPLNQTNFCITF